MNKEKLRTEFISKMMEVYADRDTYSRGRIIDLAKNAFIDVINENCNLQNISCRTCTRIELHQQVDGYGYCDKLKKQVGGIGLIIYDVDKFSCSEYDS